MAFNMVSSNHFASAQSGFMETFLFMSSSDAGSSAPTVAAQFVGMGNMNGEDRIVD